VTEGEAEPIDVTGPGLERDAGHFLDFIDSARNGGTPRSEIEDGQISTLYCHLANIALRTRRSLRCDATSGTVLNDREAMQLWSREYEPGWAPSV
jgi:hypothetical protein